MTRGGSGGMERSTSSFTLADPAQDREYRLHYHIERKSEQPLMVKQVQYFHEQHDVCFLVLPITTVAH